jgi:hypothetical protein
MDEHLLLHDLFMPDMYKDEYLKKNQIPNMTACISGYYLSSYLEFSIYPGNTRKNLDNERGNNQQSMLKVVNTGNGPTCSSKPFSKPNFITIGSLN